MDETITFEDETDDEQNVIKSGEVRAIEALDHISLELDAKNTAAIKIIKLLSAIDNISNILEVGRNLGIQPR